MNIRLVIDKMLVHGIVLSPLERSNFEASLRWFLALALRQRAHSQVLPMECNVWQRMPIRLVAAPEGVDIGGSLAKSLAQEVWTVPTV